MIILIAALHRPSKPTGVCRHAVNLAQCLINRNEVKQVILVVGSWQRQYLNSSFNLESSKIKLITVDIKNSSLTRNTWFLFGLPKLVKEIHPDIVHLSFPIPFFRSLFLCPVVSTIHDFYPYKCPENFGYPNVLFNRWFLKQCIKNSDSLACVSKITLKDLNQYFPKVSLKKNNFLVYNYVNFNQVTPQIPKNIDLKNLNSFLLCVGQHRKNKNLDILIQVYFQLRQKNRLSDKNKLIIVGATGPETDNIHQQIVNLNLEESVLLISSISDSSLRWLYQNCQLFVIPSSTEGFCLPLAEALYFSCQVVCSDISIFREIGSSNCIYFELQGETVKNLEQAICQSLKQPHKNYSDLRFSIDTVAKQYLAIYSQLL